MRDAAHEESVGRLHAGEQRQGGLVKLADQLGRLLRLGAVGVVRLRLGDRQTLSMWIGVAERPGQVGPTKDHHESMTLARRDHHLSIADLLDVFRELGAALLAQLGLDAARAPVGNQPVFVQRTKVGPRGDVARAQLQTKAKRLNHTASDFVFQWVVAEQAKVAGTAAGRDAVSGRDQASHGRVLGQSVEVRRVGRLERGLVIRGSRGDIAEAIHHEQGHLGPVFQGQVRVNRIDIHKKPRLAKRGRIVLATSPGVN